MAPLQPTDRPVKLRHDYEEEEEHEKADQVSSDNAQSDEDDSASSGPSSGAEDTAPSSDLEEEEEEEADIEESSLAGISFGALVKAQATFDPKPRKRKFAEVEVEPTSTNDGQDNEEEQFDTRKRSKEARRDAVKRTSKHAPVVESARKPVSRKRVIFEPPSSVKSRDPRFDPTVMSSNRHPNATESANKNYSFLSQYQAEEILQLKAQIKKAKDPDAVADLKRQVMSMESKIRSAEARQRETEIRKRHHEKEKEALRTRQKAKPYFLKEADVKKLAKEERLNSLGKKARDTAEKRKRKREKTKESRDMPRVRRER